MGKPWNFNRVRKGKVTADYLQGDASEKLDQLINEQWKFKLIITSPPYNMDKEYENSQTLEKYKEEIESVIAKLVKLLDEKGSICWQVGSYIDPKTKEVIPLDIFYHELFKKNGLILRNRIIWFFEHGLHASRRFSGRYETIMWYTHSGDFTFNLDNVRIPHKYPGKTHYKGAKKGEISGNPKGKNPSDVWRIVLKDWEKEVWTIPNVKANHKEKTDHPCQYPIELVERCVLALTDINDWILDPYAGVGSSMLAAYLNERNSIGIENVRKYIKIGKERLNDCKTGKLKYRKLGTPIVEPNTNTAVARKPEHFQY
jgi:DNA modification methylase